jgi:hypothetical protein
MEESIKPGQRYSFAEEVILEVLYKLPNSHQHWKVRVVEILPDLKYKPMRNVGWEGIVHSIDLKEKNLIGCIAQR